jgi:hypothetical protein
MSDITHLNESAVGMSGTEGGFDAEGSLGALTHDIEARSAALLGSHPGMEVLDVAEGQEIFRLASLGVLRRLDDRGVRGADGLMERLDTAAASDGLADIHDVAERLRQAEAMGTELGDAKAQAEQHRLGLLADAVGGTAAAIVASVMNPDGAGSVAERARDMVAEYVSGSKKDPARAVLDGLLDEAASRSLEG